MLVSVVGERAGVALDVDDDRGGDRGDGAGSNHGGDRVVMRVGAGQAGGQLALDRLQGAAAVDVRVVVGRGVLADRGGGDLVAIKHAAGAVAVDRAGGQRDVVKQVGVAVVDLGRGAGEGHRALGDGEGRLGGQLGVVVRGGPGRDDLVVAGVDGLGGQLGAVDALAVALGLAVVLVGDGRALLNLGC